MTGQLTRGISTAFDERKDLLVLALTGRTGSGCTTAAKQLGQTFHTIPLSFEDEDEPEKRKLAITQDYARAQWLPFKSISVSSAIYSFLIEEAWEDIEAELFKHKAPPSVVAKIRPLHEEILRHEDYSGFLASMGGDASPESQVKTWIFFNDVITPNMAKVRALLATNFQSFFQMVGDNVRLSGRAASSEIDPEKLFALMQRVRRLVRAAESFDRSEGIQSTRVVIDAIRNPLELVYLRDHFGSFYAVAITTDDETRRLRLSDMGLRKDDIVKLDDKEYSRGRKHLDSYETFVSQNLMECIQKSDVFVHNAGRPGEYEQQIKYLSTQLVRYVALMLRPGLVTPTRDERCMQIAFVAKLNSGCISRQVGAAVADKSFSIKAVGWNDVAKGQTPCLLRDVDSLLAGSDANTFSDFEQKDSDLKAHLNKKFQHRGKLRANEGLRCPYCFKDAYNKITGKSNQVHTRSLHAEENAFLQLAKYGSTGVEHGVLYTTASPCELCSKKAFQLGIREIVFVDPYPGISSTHVLAYGPKDERPQLRLFRGAIGHAYHRLYDPLMAVKDEYQARLDDYEPVQLPLT